MTALTDDDRLRFFLQAAASHLHDANWHINHESNRPTEPPFDWTINCQHPDCVMVRAALAATEAPATVAVPLSRAALRDIVVRCEEGDKRTDWLPTIANIARAALAATESPHPVDFLDCEVHTSRERHEAAVAVPLDDIDPERLARALERLHDRRAVYVFPLTPETARETAFRIAKAYRDVKP